ncbi:uncharacterized protein LOC124277184 [Haliotis rubra]|uniref:uncharacterized protein LOC124277184 n=1 Tax=Haliotis rubra TaxID=36100 RepID=UPI001EE588A0|nr:uncharacterized protein LOC124277184 [Haliotis rubra]
MPPTLRLKQALDYSRLNTGPSFRLPNPSTPKEKGWRSSQLFDVKIIESKTDADGTDLVKVHYVGFSSKFDQWVKASATVTRSSLMSNDPKDVFLFNVLSSVRDNLTVSRGIDSRVVIRIPITSPDVTTSLTDIAQKVSSVSSYVRHEFRFNDVHGPDILFGNDWWYRIVNKANDFAYVNRETVLFGYYERKMREEYTLNNDLKLVHRGFMFFLRFVKEKGNRSELCLLRCILNN